MAEPMPTPMSDEEIERIDGYWRKYGKYKSDTSAYAICSLLTEVRRLKAALATARAEEREACALVAIAWGDPAEGREGAAAHIAAAIRSR